MRRLLFVLFVLASCTKSTSFEPRSLEPYPNPFGPGDETWSAQPHRDKPLEVVVSVDGKRAFVSLQGTPDDPGRHVAVVDIGSGEVVAKIEVGAGATGIAVHPAGRLLVVLNRFSNYASVIDLEALKEKAKLPIDFYATEAVFSADGRELFITNRWRDSLMIWDVEVDGDELTAKAGNGPGIPVGTNPRDLAISSDGKTIAVAALTGMTVSLIDTTTRVERVRINVGAPANDVAFAGGFLIVATLSASTHHLPLAGPDTDGDGRPGDSTPNVNFQDLQNELAIYRVSDGQPVHRYTSDTICCKDYRDVDPGDIDRHGDMLAPDDRWIVAGSLPEQVAVDGTNVFVSYSASNQVQHFQIDLTTGALSSNGTWATAGHNPHGLAVTKDAIIVAHRLSETIGVYSMQGELRSTVTVGDVTGGPFPATDAEIGELFNFVTSSFSVDGDASCAHCHREDGNIDKAFSMPLTQYPGVGLRMTMAYRGAADTRPWFFESSMDDGNFKPVMNELARIENFCCTDYTLWPNGAPADCEANPPPECAGPNPSSVDGFSADRGRAFEHPRPTPYVSRDAMFKAAARALIGRDRSFADGLFFEDPITESRRSIALDFAGLTRALGLFLLSQPRLLPNPNPTGDASVRRGRALFESPATGCSACHPAPTFALSTTVNPLDAPLRMGPVVSPHRSADNINLDLFARGFVDTFPQSEMDSCEQVCGEALCTSEPRACDELRNVAFGVPSLRGIWDRAPSMLHDGRAQGLREVLCTPDHPGLAEGETGFNERDGMFDTHGGTSHLSPAQIRDLIDYLQSL